MKTMILLLLFSGPFVGPSSEANLQTIQEQLNGTWSGTWIPTEGIPDGIKIELRHNESGNLTGRFVSPTSMEFTKVSFDAKTRALVLEAADPKSGKKYRLNAQVEETVIDGTLAADAASGKIRLVKWTYVPRIGE